MNKGKLTLKTCQVYKYIVSWYVKEQRRSDIVSFCAAAVSTAAAAAVTNRLFNFICV